MIKIGMLMCNEYITEYELLEYNFGKNGINARYSCHGKVMSGPGELIGLFPYESIAWMKNDNPKEFGFHNF